MADTTHKANGHNWVKVVGCVLFVLLVIVLCVGWTLVSINDILNQPSVALRLHSFTDYTVTVVSVVGAGGTPVVGTDTTAAIVHIIFPDGTRIYTDYYAYRLEVCRVMSHDE
jgi:hypothetical protein